MITLLKILGPLLKLANLLLDLWDQWRKRAKEAAARKQYEDNNAAIDRVFADGVRSSSGQPDAANVGQAGSPPGVPVVPVVEEGRSETTQPPGIPGKQ